MIMNVTTALLAGLNSWKVKCKSTGAFVLSVFTLNLS